MLGPGRLMTCAASGRLTLIAMLLAATVLLQPSRVHAQTPVPSTEFASTVFPSTFPESTVGVEDTTDGSSTTTTTLPPTVSTFTTTTTTLPPTSGNDVFTVANEATTEDLADGGICPSQEYICRCQENADLTFVADRFGCLSCICTWKPGFEPPGYTPMATTRAAQATTRAAQATTRAAQATTRAAQATTRPDSTATTRTLPRQTTTNVRAVTVITRNEWNVFEESEYRFFSEGESWGDAERACRSYSGSLASVHGLDEMKFIFKLWGRDPFLQTWLGGQRTRGGWFAWTDRSEWDFDRFADGEPDADGKQNCVAVGHKTLGDKSKWFNRNCDKRLPFVCKRWR